MPVHQCEDTKRIHAARRLCELFKGRFSEEVANKLIEDLGGELEAVDFVLNEEANVVSRYLKENPSYVEDIRSDSKKIANLLENGIEYEIRQFACGGCNNAWWKKVPHRKQVCKCRHCKVKYDPVPQDKEWGWAKFVCPCGNEFHGFGEMGLTKSKCYKCGLTVPVERVLPPRRRIGATKKSSKPHSCNADNCFNKHDDSISAGMAMLKMSSYKSTHASRNNNITYNMSISGGGGTSGLGQGKGKKGKPTKTPDECSAAPHRDETPTCVHPISMDRRQRIRTPSKKHVSTGSTVATFLSQGSLDTASIATMARIDELE